MSRSSTKNTQYLEPNPEALEKIKHIVVLMLENRSFDNLLGWLYDAETPPRDQRFRGLDSSLWNPLSNIDSNGNRFIEQVYIRKNGQEYHLGRKTVPGKEDFRLPRPDPGEGYRDATYQLYGTYDVENVYPPAPNALGFVDNYQNAMLFGTYSFQDAPTDPREIMTCYAPEQTPVLTTLAKQFAVCDEWFCSVPSQTLPNRDFVHAATSVGYANNAPDKVCDVQTIYNQIQTAIESGRDDLSWTIYGGTQKDKHSQEWRPFSLTRLCMKQIMDAKYDANFKLMTKFFKDAEQGELPSYAFLEPQFSGVMQNDMHPPADIRPGEKLIADVYNAVKDSPGWEETLLVVTFDEHGGCYDHYPPTERAETPDAASAPGQFGFRFNRFGVRVPTVVVSPWISPGTIARPAGFTPFDHTSVIKTVRGGLGLTHLGPLTKRDAQAPDLSGLLSLGAPRTDKPEVAPRDYEIGDTAHVNDLHRLVAEILAEMIGTEANEDELHEYMHEAYLKAFPGR